jgi:hypothetical protein
MARRIYIKDGGLNTSSTIPPGYTALGTDSGDLKKKVVDTISDIGGSSVEVNTSTKLADAEFYTWGTYSVYPSNYLTTFKQSDNSFHLVEMLTKLPTHDFFDNNLESELVFGIFKENESQLNFCGAFDPMELVDPLDYIENWRKVNEVVIPNDGSRGTGYITSTNVSTSGGRGTGLILDIEAIDGEIMNWVVNNGGTGYRVGDTITVLSGDENCQMIIQGTSHNYYTNNIFYKDFIKTDGGLKMVNMLWDWDLANPYTNRYFELDITLSGTGSITDVTCSHFRNLQSVDNSSIEELNSGWTIGDITYLDNFCQKNFANPKIWYYTRTNDSTDQIDYCKYDLSTNTIEIILEDLRSWWDVNADVPWEIDGSELSIRGGILPHPDKPLLLANHSGDILSDSYLIGPDTYHRFGDNKTTDYQTRLYTKNKMWIINPIVP